jgi:3-hydroxyacyl-CoA dehydrogenase
MRYADEVGLFNVVRAMQRHAAADPANRQAGAWVPAPLLARLAADGKSFT